MKKLLGIVASVVGALLIAVPVPASAWWRNPNVTTGGGTYIHEYNSGGNARVGGYTEFVSHNKYEANGFRFATGCSDAEGTMDHGEVVTPRTAGVYTTAGIKSEAKAASRFGGMDSVHVSGQVWQGTRSYTEAAPGTWAAGGQESTAGYSANDYGLCRAHADGNAETTGGTLTAARTTGNNSTALAATGSYGNANANCCPDYTFVNGNGSVEHATLAQDRITQSAAWTHGTACYSYGDCGYHNANGYGGALTYGTSNVTNTPNGMTAHAHSVSVSTGSTCGNSCD